MLKKEIKRNIFFLLLFCFYRLFFFFIFQHQTLSIVDEQQYNKLALCILNSGEFGWRHGHLTAIRPPLYPVFLFLTYKLFGANNYNVVRVIQIFISLVSGYLVYWIGKRIFKDKNIAILSCLIFLFYPSLTIFNYLILTETLFIFLFLLSICFFVLSVDSCKIFNNYNYILFIILAGISWGLSSLTRSVLYPLIPFVGIFIFFVFPRRKHGIIASILFIISVILTLSPWIIRNYRVFGHFVAVDTMGGLNLYMGNYEHTPLHRAWAAVDNPPEIAWYRGHGKELHGLNEAEKQRWATKKAFEFILSHPGLTLIRSLIKIANFWQLERTIIAGMQKGYFPGLENRILQIFLSVFILLSYVFVAILGFIALIWRIFYKRTYFDIFILLLFLYFTGIHALVFGHSRYHLPLIPFLCMYTAYFIYNLPDMKREKHFKTISASVIIFFGIIWSYDIFIGSKEKILQFIKRVLKI